MVADRTNDHVVTVTNGYVPVIDLGLPMPAGSPRRVAVAEAIQHAFATSGFFVIVGHAVPEATVTGLYRAARRFFGLDEAAKQAIPVDPLDTLQRGCGRYQAMEKFTATALGEDVGKDPGADRYGLRVPNKWPALPGFRETFLTYYGAMEHLAMELMQLIALGLGLPEHWFDDKFADHMSQCSLNYYMPQPEPPAPGSLRNVPHSDYAALTILYQDDAPGGLQIRDREGAWFDVPAIPDSFVVNLGRLMSMWTNDRLDSTVHQVVNPPAEQSHLDRISIAYFSQPGPDALIECIPTCTDEHNPPRYKPMTSGAYFVSRSRRLFVQRQIFDRQGSLPTGTVL
jgi:isopenicillin N synthase-like dioxygenase